MSECKYREQERWGLYIMIFIIFMSTCDGPDFNDELDKIDKKLTQIEEKINVQ